MERTKKFKFNLLDVVIIIVAVACVAGILIRSSLADKIIKKDVEAKVTFTISNVRTDVAKESLLEGDLYYCKEFNGKFGEICDRESFEFAPAKQHYRSEDGTLVESTLNHRSDVTGYMKVTGRFDEEVGFLVDGVNHISPGARFEVNSAHRKMEILIISVDPVEVVK